MILDDLVAATRIRLARHQQPQSLTELKRIVAHQPSTTKSDFLTILKQPGLQDRKSTRLNSSHSDRSRMPSSA